MGLGSELAPSSLYLDGIRNNSISIVKGGRGEICYPVTAQKMLSGNMSPSLPPSDLCAFGLKLSISLLPYTENERPLEAL